MGKNVKKSLKSIALSTCALMFLGSIATASTVALTDRENGVSRDDLMISPEEGLIGGFTLAFSAEVESAPSGPSGNFIHNALRDNFTVGELVDIEIDYSFSSSQRTSVTNAPLPFMTLLLQNGDGYSFSHFVDASYNTETETLVLFDEGATTPSVNLEISGGGCGLDGGTLFGFLTAVENGCATSDGGLVYARAGLNANVDIAEANEISLTAFEIAPAAVPLPASLGFLLFGLAGLLGLSRR